MDARQAPKRAMTTPPTPRKPSAALPLLIYNLVFPFAFLAMLPGLARRMVRRGNFRRKFGQRFARYDEGTRRRLGEGGWVWIHSISVGETLLALRLIRQMRELHPGLRVVLSATTSTGFALAEENSSEWLEPVYNPIDAWPLVRRALDAIRPERLIFIEAVWPNLLAQAGRARRSHLVDRAAFPALRSPLPAVPLFHRANLPPAGRDLRAGAGRPATMAVAGRRTRANSRHRQYQIRPTRAA